MSLCSESERGKGEKAGKFITYKRASHVGIDQETHAFEVLTCALHREREGGDCR
jgi:hypothetical protein